MKLPIAIEDLDFERKKQELSSRGMNRMLSSFAYGKFRDIMTSRCARLGVALISINPAYTSIIGKYKFAEGYGLSTHEAAALAIARRAQNYGEQLKTKAKHCPITNPVRNRNRHIWSDWARLSRELKKVAGMLSNALTPRRPSSGPNRGTSVPSSITSQCADSVTKNAVGIKAEKDTRT